MPRVVRRNADVVGDEVMKEPAFSVFLGIFIGTVAVIVLSIWGPETPVPPVKVPVVVDEQLPCPPSQSCITTMLGEVWYHRSYVDENMVVEIERGRNGRPGRVTLIRRCGPSENCIREKKVVWP